MCTCKTEKETHIKLFINKMDWSPFWSTYEPQLLQDIPYEHIRHMSVLH